MYNSMDPQQPQQQLQLLQQKLLQTHTKLIDQLDICKQQQLTIIQLSKKIIQLQKQQLSSSHQYDTFNYQSFGGQKQNNHSSNVEDKMELMQADLDAMRNKVLMEITEKNRMKEALKEMRSNYKGELGELKRQLDQQHRNVRSAKAENQQLKQCISQLRRETSTKAEQQLQTLTQKCISLQQKYQTTKQSTKVLLDEKLHLTQLLTEQKLRSSQLQQQMLKRSKESFSKQHNMNVLAESNVITNYQQKQINNLKYEIQKLNRNVQKRDVEFKESRQGKKPKGKVNQDTMMLIRKLEQAESGARRKKQNRN